MRNSILDKMLPFIVISSETKLSQAYGRLRLPWPFPKASQ